MFVCTDGILGQMWNHWSDVTRKIKDIATEIAQSHYDFPEDGQGTDTAGENAHNTHLVDPRLSSHGATRGHHTAPDHHRGPSQPLAEETGGVVAPPTRSTAASSMMMMTPPLRQTRSSVHEDNCGGSTACPSDKTHAFALDTSSRRGDVDFVAATPQPTVAVNGGSMAHSHEDRVAELLLQVRRVSEEKQEIERQVSAFQDEMREANRKTVESFEQKIALLQDQVTSEIKQKEEFHKQLVSSAQEHAGIQGEVERLKEREKSLLHEVITAKTAHDEVSKLLAVRDREYMESLARIKTIENARDALRMQLTDAENTLAGNSPGVGISVVCGDTVVKSDDMLTVETEETKLRDLYHSISTLEQEKLTVMRQKEEMDLLLKETFCVLRGVFSEREDILSLGHEQTKLFMELIQRLERERQETQWGEKGGETMSETTTQQKNYEEKEKKMLVVGNEMEEVEKIISSLKAKIVTLTTQLDIAKQDAAETVSRVKLELEEKQARAICYFTAQHERQTCDAIQTLRCELQDTQRQLRESQEAQSSLRGFAGGLSVAEGRAEELQSTLAAAQGSNERHDASLVSALTARKKELEAERAQRNELMQQLELIISDCLVRADVELLSSRDGAPVSFSDKLTLLASEFDRLFAANQNAMKREKEWEHTYEQARSVNATLTQQVSEAWKTIGTLREDLSMRDQLIARLKQQNQTDAQQHGETQRLLTSVTNQLQALREEKSAWETRVAESNSEESCHQEKLAAVNADVDALQRALHDREEELEQAQRSKETLQQVLDTFTRNKTRDVEERTADLQIEIDQLRAQLLTAEEQRQRHQDEIDKLGANHRREVAAKNLEITSLHRKHAELRMALDETARQLNGSMMIDKRVISHLTVNFIGAFVAQRPEADEMLKVLSGLLNWDEALQEKAGLLPGPANPRPGQQRRGRSGLIGGIVSTVWGSSGRGAAGKNGGSGASPSIAELWVDFLMRESEVVLAETKDPAVGATAAQEDGAVVTGEESGNAKKPAE